MKGETRHGRRNSFWWIALAVFCASWAASLVGVYLLVPVLREAVSAPFFAVAASSFLLGFAAALGFLVIRPLLREREAERVLVDFSEMRLFGPN